MIRLATLTALIALMLAAAGHAGELTPRASVLRFTDRFGGEPIKVAAEAPPKIASRPMLKSEATVIGDIVRIGDLVENAGDVADVEIFRAPDLGQTGTVPARRVINAVLPHNIIGLDTRGLAEVVVTRASRLITAKDIEARIVQALAGHSGLPDAANLTVTFDNIVRPLQVEAAVTSDLRIARLGFDPRSGRFDVSLELPGSAAARKLLLRFTGAISETFEALVPARAIAQGEVLDAGDLVTARRPKSESGPNTVRETEQAIGFAAKRALRAGQVIRRNDLAKPQLVARNEAVSIAYVVPGIVVSIRGQALEPGAMGDVINVLNVQSKKTLQATVTGPGRVSVAASNPRVANLPSNAAR
jgi:flagellar basal body P-ring formation protein FlgA